MEIVNRISEKFNMFKENQEAASSMVAAAIMVVVLLAVLYIAIPILSGIQASTTLVEGDAFYNSSQALITTTDTVFDMLGILPIVAVAVAVIGALVGIVMFA